jgi:hypothetical protein
MMLVRGCCYSHTFIFTGGMIDSIFFAPLWQLVEPAVKDPELLAPFVQLQPEWKLMMAAVLKQSPVVDAQSIAIVLASTIHPSMIQFDVLLLIASFFYFASHPLGRRTASFPSAAPAGDELVSSHQVLVAPRPIARSYEDAEGSIVLNSFGKSNVTDVMFN